MVLLCFLKQNMQGMYSFLLLLFMHIIVMETSRGWDSSLSASE